MNRLATTAVTVFPWAVIAYLVVGAVVTRYRQRQRDLRCVPRIEYQTPTFRPINVVRRDPSPTPRKKESAG